MVSVISDRSMESGLRDLAEQRKDYNVVNVNNALRTVRDFHFHNTNFDAPMRTPSKEDQNVFLSREGGNIASFLFRMKEDYPIGFQRVERVMRLVYPEFATFVFDPRGGYVQLKWEESTGDFIYSGLNASDGTLRFIALATLLCQDPNNGWSPKTILIDEPELGLHPYALEVLASLIRQNTWRQIIIATQSAQLLRYFEPTEIVTVAKRNGETVFSRPTEQTMLLG